VRSKHFPNRYPKQPRDFYPTPLVTVEPLIQHLRAARVIEFCEPCAAQGHLVRLGRSDVNSQCCDGKLHNRGYAAVDCPASGNDCMQVHQAAVISSADGSSKPTGRPFSERREALNTSITLRRRLASLVFPRRGSLCRPFGTLLTGDTSEPWPNGINIDRHYRDVMLQHKGVEQSAKHLSLRRTEPTQLRQNDGEPE
jgi:hypothetical protein